MRRYKNILVAVDGSQASFHALEESIRLAQWGKGGATVIHVAPFYEGDLSLVGVKDIKAAVDGPGSEILQGAMDIAKRHDFSVNTLLARGEIHESIVKQALMHDADLIVLGAARTPFVARLFAGSVLRNLIALCPKDILVIPHQATIRWDKVLIPINSSPNDFEAAVRAMEVVKTYGAELGILLFIKAYFHTRGNTGTDNKYLPGKRSEKVLEDIQMEAERASLNSEIRVVRGRFQKAVSKIARENHPSMIVIGLHKKSLAGRAFGRASISRIVYNSSCPVLLV